LQLVAWWEGIKEVLRYLVLFALAGAISGALEYVGTIKDPTLSTLIIGLILRALEKAIFTYNKKQGIEHKVAGVKFKGAIPF